MVRITFDPYDEPLLVGYHRRKPLYHEGKITATWDSPAGPVSLTRSVEYGPKTPNNYEMWRHILAQELAVDLPTKDSR